MKKINFKVRKKFLSNVKYLEIKDIKYKNNKVLLLEILKEIDNSKKLICFVKNDKKMIAVEEIKIEQFDYLFEKYNNINIFLLNNQNIIDLKQIIKNRNFVCHIKCNVITNKIKVYITKSILDIEKIIINFIDKKIKNYELIKSIIDEWDPVGLLENGAPIDEYDLEVELICNKLHKEITIDELSLILQNVLLFTFDDTVSKKDYLITSKKIINKIDL